MGKTMPEIGAVLFPDMDPAFQRAIMDECGCLDKNNLDARLEWCMTYVSIATSYGVPGIVAPTASFDLLQEAVKAADELGIHKKVGTVYTSDFFYHPDPEVNDKAKAMGHLAVEMEAAGLYLTAMAAHKKALALFQISDHIYTGEALSAAERQDGFREMMEVALTAASRVAL